MDIDRISNGLTTYSLTALSRWSVANTQLPAVNQITSLHVYDFDNTLFNSPLPNNKLWTGPTIGLLQRQETFASGGWWHDSRILAATGQGLEKEESRAWGGWWNEKIVELVQLSMQQKDALTVLLTGRAEDGFSSLLQRMVTSKGLDFDIVALKPVTGPNNQKFSRTLQFKEDFLTNLVETYVKAEDIRIYEDRPRHVKDFRDFFTEYNKRQNGIGGNPSRGPITAEVIQVADGATSLDPIQEVAEVQRILNNHNSSLTGATANKRLQIKKTVFYTGYLINDTDSQRLLTLAHLPSNMSETEMKVHANSVLITPRPCNDSILEKVGGMGSKTTWEVTGTAVYENRIWAARVQPVPDTQKIYTENPVPMVVLALRKGVKPSDAGKIQNWQPVPTEQQIRFDSVVGEKVILRIEAEDPHEGEYESLFPNKYLKRNYTQDDEPSIRFSSSTQDASRQGSGARSSGVQPHYHGNGSRGGKYPFRGNAVRGGRGNFRGNSGSGRGRGRGGGHHRSLDDVGENSSTTANGYNVAVAYEDFPPLQKQYQTPQQLVQQQFDQYQRYQRQLQSSGKGQADGTSELQYS